MAYVKTYLPTLKTHVVNLKRDAKDLSRDSQRLEVRGKLGSKTLYYVNVIKLKGEIIWKGGLSHQSGLAHLPGVPLLHVNRPSVEIST